jgi:hypothetical protein
MLRRTLVLTSLRTPLFLEPISCALVNRGSRRAENGSKGLECYGHEFALIAGRIVDREIMHSDHLTMTLPALGGRFITISRRHHLPEGELGDFPG